MKAARRDGHGEWLQERLCCSVKGNVAATSQGVEAEGGEVLSRLEEVWNLFLESFSFF